MHVKKAEDIFLTKNVHYLLEFSLFFNVPPALSRSTFLPITTMKTLAGWPLWNAWEHICSHVRQLPENFSAGLKRFLLN